MRNPKIASWLLPLALAMPLASRAGEEKEDLTQYVDPMIATKGEANGFPGPKLPFGMVSLSPDCGESSANSGYGPGRIRGFSHLHVSGTGGGPKYGVILISPTTGSLDVTDYGSEQRAREIANTGYFGVNLLDYDVRAELTVTRRAGFHRYTFPASDESHILLDVFHHLSRKGYGEEQTFEGGKVRIVSDREMVGFGTYKGGWNMGDAYTVFFCAQFDTPCSAYGTWKAANVQKGSRSAEADSRERLGAFFSYKTGKNQVIRVKVGISFISAEQARKNVSSEIPHWSFETVRNAAVEEWNAALRRIAVSFRGAPRRERKFYEKELVNFYSALYRCHLMPSDRTGENPKWTSSEPNYDDYYCIWDTYRTLHPLLTLIQTERQVAMVRSLVDIYAHDGYMPDGRSGNCNGRTQGGSNAEVVVADAFVKGLVGIDYEKAYKAMLKDAEVPPKDHEREGRGGLKEYNQKGYISVANPRSGTRTVEYSLCDFAIAQVAAGLGKTADARRYLDRSGNWKNLWDPELQHLGFKGFIRAKNADGSWVENFDPLERGTWPDVFYEDNSWSYSLAVPHDVAGVTQHCGGRETFLQRLDFFFATKPPDDSMFRIGNEPDFFIPYMYIWAGRPDKTAEVVRQTSKQFHDRRGDPWMPGNDDAGAMSSWYIFAVAGFYPNAGTDLYIIGSPLFPKITFHLENGQDFVVVAENLFPLKRNRYVQSATLNGKPLDQAWFRHGDIKDGGTLILRMGKKPSAWGTKNPPPSGADLIRLPPEGQNRQAAAKASSRLPGDQVFPTDYPAFLKRACVLSRQVEQLRRLRKSDRDAALNGQPKDMEAFLRTMLKSETLNVRRLIGFARAQVGQREFDAFLHRFGISADKQHDIELEVMAQISRSRRREAHRRFVEILTDPSSTSAERRRLIEKSEAPRELEYALRHCEEEEFETIRDIVAAKQGFGPRTPQDKNLLAHLEDNRSAALDEGDKEAATKWRAVLAQLISRPVARAHGRLPFSKWELFAMIRNAERTLEQRKRPFLDITSEADLDEKSASYAFEIIKRLDTPAEATQKQRVVAYAFLDSDLGTGLRKLKQTYRDILSNEHTGQTERTRMSVRNKRELLEILEYTVHKRMDTRPEVPRTMLAELVRKILESRGEPYRLPFIQGIVLVEGRENRLACRLIEAFPMIVAGDAYPYQWKHDNEVNIALLLANIDPYQAAQAVRFIIYHGMWRSRKAEDLGLYGWLPQIIFTDRQTGSLPEFNGKTSYYFPDFRFRPTREIDAENERNRTSEIMQLPFFGWTVWRVYEELEKINGDHALAFLEEVYPYVRANTEAVRTALDPLDEAVLSGRDAWVNGMDNAWYHHAVMNRHLPERCIPRWAWDVVKKNRVDNRTDKKPGNPIDPDLATGRPSEYYYAYKVVFHDIMRDLGLEPVPVYHASPYNAKDGAITAVMARSLQAQVAMAEVLKKAGAEMPPMTRARARGDEGARTWDEEIGRYDTYLGRMKKAVNDYLWSDDDKTYYNRDVTQMFRSVVEQQFCRLTVAEGQFRYKPRAEYWTFQAGEQGGGRYVLNPSARDCAVIDESVCAVSMDPSGKIRYEYKVPPQYWTSLKGEDGRQALQLNVTEGDPFIVEQFSHVKKDESAAVGYKPNVKYWEWVEDGGRGGHYELNERAKTLLGNGARRIADGELLRWRAIAGFFPLFGRIPDEDQAFELATQVVNPWMWWPVDGIPIPSQPMMIPRPNGEYVANEVYDPDKYWLGPTWMSATKPVIDGLHSYGYEMIYLYVVRRTVATLQDGRAVEHWRPETGQVNTTNVNFPWAASCMAGSIWKELTSHQQLEYLRRFHPPAMPKARRPQNSVRRQVRPTARKVVPFRPSLRKLGEVRSTHSCDPPLGRTVVGPVGKKRTSRKRRSFNHAQDLAQSSGEFSAGLDGLPPSHTQGLVQGSGDSGIDPFAVWNSLDLPENDGFPQGNHYRHWTERWSVSSPQQASGCGD